MIRTCSLLGTVYQPSPQIEEKMEWLDKIETILSIIASTFTGTIILAADNKHQCKQAIKTPVTIPRNS